MNGSTSQDGEGRTAALGTGINGEAEGADRFSLKLRGVGRRRYFSVIDRTSRKPVYTAKHRETALLWITVNAAGRANIDVFGEVFCLCGNVASEYGFEYVERDGAFTGPEGSCEYLVCLCCRRHIDARTGDVLGEIDIQRYCAGMDALHPEFAPHTPARRG